MLDNALFILLIELLANGLASIGQTPNIQQGYQPTEEGVPSGPTVFIYKIGDTPVGAPEQLAEWKDDEQALFTASFAAGVMTVTLLVSGAVAVGQTVQGMDIPDNTIITSIIDSLAGTYGVSQSFTLAPVAATSIQGMENTQLQQYESTFQINALSIQDPSNSTQVTASDLVNYVRAVVQSDAFITGLESQSVGVLRPGNVRNPYFVDDKGRFEANPSFDFTLTHKQIIVSTNPVVTAETFTVLPV